MAMYVEGGRHAGYKDRARTPRNGSGKPRAADRAGRFTGQAGQAGYLSLGRITHSRKRASR